MKRLLLALLMVAPLACSTLGTSRLVEVDAVRDATTLVCDDHDKYVAADSQLAPADQQAALAESQKLRSFVQPDAQYAEPTLFREALEPVASRFETYVQVDPLLLPWERQTLLRTPALLRRMADEASN